MNETINTIMTRRSCRAYTEQEVSAADLETIVQCGQYAATGMGAQPWHFAVLTNKDLMGKITAANREIMLKSENPMMAQIASDPNFCSWRHAPAVIIVSGEKASPWSVADCANATENMALAASALGLGNCYIASFKGALLQPENADLLTALQIPTDYEPMFALTIGYAAAEPDERKPRKDGAISYIN